jgi:ethanolamine utilization protein EutA
LARSLAEVIDGLPEPIIIITKIDIAMSLSQILKGLIPNKRIITVDGIDVEDGDYLDIGLPLRNGDDISSAAIPIVVKTLLFYK